mgnify:FL=1|nr:MAG TPA: dUTPase [Caudoviricetes sp.]
MQITLSLNDFINKTSELMQQAYKYKDKRGLFLNETDWNNLSLMLLELQGRRESDMEKIQIKYFDKEIDKVEKINKGDWIDLRSAETIHLKKGEFRLIPLGVGMKLPEGYEVNIVPRSSTYKNFKVLQTNSFAVIDNSYSGDNDQWLYPVIAMEDTIIHKNDRICQFRINKVQPEIEFEEVEHLDEVDRGSFGSTGKA